MKVAQSLGELGNSVQLVLAGREACSHIIRLQNNERLCEEAFLKFLLRINQPLPLIVPNSLVSDTDLEAEVERIWAAQVSVKSEQRAFGAYRLREISKLSVLRRLRSAPGGESKNASLSDVEDSYQKDTLRHLLYYKRLWHNQQPDIVLYFGGHFHQDRSAFLICRELSIPSVAVESCFIPNLLYFDPAGVSGSRGAISRADIIHTLEAIETVPQCSLINALLHESLGVNEARINVRSEERLAIRSRLGIQPNEKVAIFLCQVPYDAAVIEDGGDYHNQAFAIENVVGCLVSFVGWKTLIRLHPKDDTLVVKDCISKLQQTTNILIPNQVSTLSLYESVIASDAAITVNSQAALQASWLGLPVLILGNAFYSAKGFTTDILGQHELLHAGINATLTQGRTTSNQEVVSYLCEMHSQYLLNINDIASATSRITQMARYHK